MFNIKQKANYSLTVFLVAVTTLGACGGTWNVEKDLSSLKETDSQPAVIERLETRKSPKIKAFTHLDLGIHKRSAGSDSNPAYDVNRVRTFPGKVQIRVMFPGRVVGYLPEVEFIAAPNHKYLLTWVCIPYPFVAVIDADSSRIVALDSYCPDCDDLIGSVLSPSTECLDAMQPPWMESEETSFWGWEWSAWALERLKQEARNLCFAAEHGVRSARRTLAVFCLNGLFGVKRDPVRAYFWFRLAAESGDQESVKVIKWLEQKELTSAQLEEAQHLLHNWEYGECEADVVPPGSQKYKIQIGN